MVEFPRDVSPADMDSPGADAVGTPPRPQSSAKRASSLLSVPWRFFRERSEARARRREEETSWAGIRREQRRAERACGNDAPSSGALGCYPLSRAVLASEGRVLTDLNRNARLIDGDAAGIRPGDVVVSSMMEDAGFLAPLDDDEDDDDDEARRVGDDDDHLDDDDLNTRTAGDAPERHAVASDAPARAAIGTGARAALHARTPGVLRAARPRRRARAGTGTGDKDPSDGEDELLNEKNGDGRFGDGETFFEETRGERRECQTQGVAPRRWTGSRRVLLRAAAGDARRRVPGRRSSGRGR